MLVRRFLNAPNLQWSLEVDWYQTEMGEKLQKKEKTVQQSQEKEVLRNVLRKPR